MKPKKEVTIYDIAKKLALSSATVSRALKDHPAINKKTRKKIQEAARELGYRHNNFASNLRKQKTNTIGVIVHELNSNFITSVLAGIEKITAESGYDLIIAHSSENFKKESANALNFFHKRVDGLIASLAFDTEGLDHYKSFTDRSIPVIFFDRVEENSESTKVIIDNYKCGYQATQHLIEQGCKRVVLVTANLKRNVYAQRYKGYKDALYDNNIPFRENYVLIKDLSEQSGIEAALEILKMKPQPDGTFITNDFSAAVCMQTLKEHGIRIPEDIAVVGFNNDAIGKIVEPQLTTIDYPGIDMGEIAAQHLINHLKGSSNIKHTQTIVIRSDLIIRKSSLKKNFTKSVMKAITLAIITLFFSSLKAEDGYDLWLRYNKVSNILQLNQYKQQINSTALIGNSQTISIIKNELAKAFSGLTGSTYKISSSVNNSTTFILGTAQSSTFISTIVTRDELDQIGNEGFIIKSKTNKTLITANTDIGLLYGMFHFLRLMQTEQSITRLNIISSPKLRLRLLNHWDNLSRTVERGYAGFSIWNWHTLPDYIDKRYIDYARANASIGINGTVLTNVNANATILTKPYLEKVKALADLFRPYGIKVYLTARFSAPIEIGGLKTANPLNDSVQLWWKNKVKEIYFLIPDFGGFLVKANSEGQPGPQDYNRTHADGANMLADAMAPFNGIVIWRAFVYSQNSNDRFKQAYEEFKPLDGKFRKNVLVQVKNGPIDFQPREPLSPLFGAVHLTPLMIEFQLTQEYLGQGTHLVYEAPLFKEVLSADTYSKGRGSTVAKVIDGSLDNFSLNGMAGVSNIGNDINWCGHPFAQANWYALGRLAWDYNLSSEQIADEWIKQTFTNHNNVVAVIKNIMLNSREALVNYMTPIGLTHIMYNGHHYGPMPWGNTLNRPDWNPVYYHKADSIGIGFDRTAKGSNALSQYTVEVSKQYDDVNKCPDEFLLWFHHAAWDHKMHSGRTVWNELCYKYYTGVDSVKSFIKQWNNLEKYIDEDRFNQVKQLLNIQLKDATWWRNACLSYFQTFSKMPIPVDYEQPDKTLEYYKNIRILFAPGN